MTEWIGLIQNFGVAVCILVFLGWCATRAAPWAARKADYFFERALKAADKADAFDDRLAKIEQRIDTLWDFQLRRAAIEAIKEGIGKMNSPLVISSEAKTWLGELAAELKAFYRRLGRSLTNSQLAEEIERRFGDEIVKRVCIPHGLFQGACLLIAMQVAKEQDEPQEAP